MAKLVEGSVIVATKVVYDHYGHRVFAIPGWEFRVIRFRGGNALVFPSPNSRVQHNWWMRSDEYKLKQEGAA